MRAWAKKKQHDEHEQATATDDEEERNYLFTLQLHAADDLRAAMAERLELSVMFERARKGDRRWNGNGRCRPAAARH